MSARRKAHRWPFKNETLGLETARDGDSDIGPLPRMQLQFLRPLRYFVPAGRRAN